MLTGLYSFFSVKNHGIPEESIEAVISASRRFFSLPEVEKLKVSWCACCFYILIPAHFGDYLIRIGFAFKLDVRSGSGYKGYHPLLSSNNNQENMGDMHEGYGVGWEELDSKSDDSKRSNDGALAAANVWPTELPDFRESVLKY